MLWLSAVQTGSGKTYTMEGVPGDPGVTFRAIEALFSIVEERGPGAHYTFKASLLRTCLLLVATVLVFVVTHSVHALCSVYCARHS